MTDRHNPEHFLLSAVLRSKSYTAVLGHELDSSMFEEYGDEWAWLIAYVEKYKRIPELLIFEQQFPEFQCLAVDDQDSQARKVKENYASRQLLARSSVASQLVNQGDLLSAQSELQSALLEAGRFLGVVSDGDVLTDHSDVLADIESYHDRIVDTGFAGIPTGFKTWDAVTGGCKPGEFIIVGARLGQGKSWAMTKMAASALMEGYTALYDSLEMTRTNITLRVQTMLSQAVGRPYAAADLMTGTTIPDLVEYREIIAHLQDHVPGALHVADTTKGRISPMTIAAQIERIQPDIVFVDYLTLLDMQGEGDWKSVAALSNAMQSLAQRYKIPIVAAAQLNRADGRTREVPGSDALARSDSVGQDADQVMNLQRKSTRVVKQKLVKNRHGMDGMSWYSEFRPGAGVIEEINQERAYELIDEDGVDEA